MKDFHQWRSKYNQLASYRNLSWFISAFVRIAVIAVERLPSHSIILWKWSTSTCNCVIIKRFHFRKKISQVDVKMARRACVCVCVLVWLFINCSSLEQQTSCRKRRGCFCGKVEGKMKSFLIIFAAVADWHKQLVLSISTSSVAHRIDCAEQVSKKWVRQRECSLTTYLSQTHTTYNPKMAKWNW